MDNSKQTVTKHIVGEASATLIPEFAASTGDLAYQWYRAEETNLMSEKVAFDKLPKNAKVSYGKDYIRLLTPTDPSNYYHQDVGVGGDSNKFYVAMKVYVPENTAYVRNGAGTLSSADLPALTDIHYEPGDNECFGRDAKGLYYYRWNNIAAYSNGTWSSYVANKGENEYIGYKYLVAWYDADENEIGRIVIPVQYANETNFNAVENFQEIDGATANEYTATEPGLYKLHITRIRNRATTEAESIEYRVTNAPAVPVFDEDTFTGEKSFFVTELENKEAEFTIGWESDIESDEFIITWKMYRTMAGKEDLTIAVQKVRNVYSASFNPADELYKSIFEAAGEDLEARYYATIQNKLNGVTSAVTGVPSPTNMFYVTD